MFRFSSEGRGKEMVAAADQTLVETQERSSSIESGATETGQARFPRGQFSDSGGGNCPWCGPRPRGYGQIHMTGSHMVNLIDWALTRSKLPRWLRRYQHPCQRPDPSSGPPEKSSAWQPCSTLKSTLSGLALSCPDRLMKGRPRAVASGTCDLDPSHLDSRLTISSFTGSSSRTEAGISIKAGIITKRAAESTGPLGDFLKYGADASVAAQ
ncbi:hypothetical protein DEMA109039_14925 [Deinococcus marmoris]